MGHRFSELPRHVGLARAARPAMQRARNGVEPALVLGAVTLRLRQLPSQALDFCLVGGAVSFQGVESVPERRWRKRVRRHEVTEYVDRVTRPARGRLGLRRYSGTAQRRRVVASRVIVQAPVSAKRHCRGALTTRADFAAAIAVTHGAPATLSAVSRSASEAEGGARAS